MFINRTFFSLVNEIVYIYTMVLHAQLKFFIRSNVHMHLTSSRTSNFISVNNTFFTCWNNISIIKTMFQKDSYKITIHIKIFLKATQLKLCKKCLNYLNLKSRQTRETTFGYEKSYIT